jgi:hypothetical protein
MKDLPAVVGELVACPFCGAQPVDTGSGLAMHPFHGADKPWCPIAGMTIVLDKAEFWNSRATLTALTAEAGKGEAAAKPTTVPREPAPPHSLPEWHECQSVIENYEFHLRVIAGNEGPQLVTVDPDPREPTELERFIYEYDDADSYRSEWFLHRLEKLIKFIRADALSTATPAGEWREEEVSEGWLRKIAADALATPPGWALVPIDPLPQMLEAAGTINGWSGDEWTADDDHIAWWKAMLAASPRGASESK